MLSMIALLIQGSLCGSMVKSGLIFLDCWFLCESVHILRVKDQHEPKGMATCVAANVSYCKHHMLNC